VYHDPIVGRSADCDEDVVAQYGFCTADVHGSDLVGNDPDDLASSVAIPAALDSRAMRYESLAGTDTDPATESALRPKEQTVARTREPEVDAMIVVGEGEAHGRDIDVLHHWSGTVRLG